MIKNKEKRNIIDYLKFNNVFILSHNNNKIYGVINGGILLIIIVNKKKRTTKLENKIINNITEKGGISFLAHTCEEVKLNLKSYFL